MENNENMKDTSKKKSTNKKVKTIKQKNPINKDKIIYSLIAIIILLIAFNIFLLIKLNSPNSKLRENTKYEDGVEVSVNKRILKERDLNGIKFSNVSLKQEGQIATISADLTNTTSEAQSEFNLDIKFKDKDGKVILALGDIVPILESNQTYNFSTMVNCDIVNSYDIEVTKVDMEDETKGSENITE